MNMRLIVKSPLSRFSGGKRGSRSVVQDFKNLHRLRRIDARAHGPDDLLQIHRIDVVVDRDVVAIHARAGLHAGDRGERLQRLAGVTLFQRDHHHQSVAMAPDPLDVRDAGLLQMIPDARGVKRNAVALGDRQKRRIAEQDRIIAMENPLDANDAFIAAMGVISRPFAEWPFRVRLFFGRGISPSMTISEVAGTGSPVNGARITSSGAPRNAPAYSYSLTPALAADGAAIQVAGSQPSTMATGQARPGLPIFARDLFAVFVLDDPERDAIFADDAGAVGADVDPAAVRIFDNHHVAGADVAAAVVLVPFGRGKIFQVDAVAFENILALSDRTKLRRARKV